MGLTEQNPATKDGNGIQVWGEPPRRHPGSDGIADATHPEVDAQYEDGQGDAAPAGKLAGPSYAVSGGASRQASGHASSAPNADKNPQVRNKEARRDG